METALLWIAILFAAAFANESPQSSEMDNRTELEITTAIRDAIFTEYNPRIRPPPPDGSRGPVNVSVAIVPQYIEGIDESESKFTILVGVDLYWNDPRLSWAESDYLNQSCIFAEFQEIWSPEVRFTMAMIDDTDLKDRSLVRICSEGLVHVTDFRRVSRFAEFKTENFPLDTQNLIVGFAQTSAGVQEVDMTLISQNTTVTEKRLVLPADWKMQKIKCKRYLLSSMNEVHPQKYAAIYCFVNVKRDPSHVIINFCIPTFAVTLLAVVAIHSAESARGPRTAKYELGLVSLMSVSVLTLSMTDALPHSGHVSRLHIFYYAMMSAIFTSCLVSWMTVMMDKAIRRASSSSSNGVSVAKNRRFRLPPCRITKNMLKVVDVVSAAFHIMALISCFIWFLMGTNF